MAKSKAPKSKKSDRPKAAKKVRPAKADTSKDELKAAKATIKKLTAQIAKLEKAASKAAKKAKVAAPTVEDTKAAPQPVVPNLSTRTPNTADPRTVAQLRAEARAKGIAGYSSMRKDQLVAALDS